MFTGINSYTAKHATRFSEFVSGTENAKPCRTESYYLQDLFKQGVGNGGMIEKDGGRANAITLLMAERILPGP